MITFLLWAQNSDNGPPIDIAQLTFRRSRFPFFLVLYAPCWLCATGLERWRSQTHTHTHGYRYSILQATITELYRSLICSGAYLAVRDFPTRIKPDDEGRGRDERPILEHRAGIDIPASLVPQVVLPVGSSLSFQEFTLLLPPLAASRRRSSMHMVPAYERSDLRRYALTVRQKFPERCLHWLANYYWLINTEGRREDPLHRPSDILYR